MMGNVRLKVISVIGSAGLMLAVMTSPLMAWGLGAGIQGSVAFVETDGTETLKQSSNKTSDSKNAFVPLGAAYIQVMLPGFNDQGFVIGASRVPGSAEIVAEERSVYDYVGANAAGIVNNLRKQVVKVEIENHDTIYIETPTFAGIYLTAGWTTLDIVTKESLDTGATYGNGSVDGTMFGIGGRTTLSNGIHFKIQYSVTDFDTLTLKSTGSDAATTVAATPEAQMVTLSLGYQF